MTLRVRVIPRSSMSSVVGELPDGTLKVKLASIPERGKANSELCRVLAEHYGVAKSVVTVVSGHPSPFKLVRIDC
jgi:uncharacterized protein